MQHFPLESLLVLTNADAAWLLMTRYAGKGRPRKIGAEQIRKLKVEGIGPTEIAKRLGIGRASVYRAYRTTEQPITAPGPRGDVEICRRYQGQRVEQKTAAG
jgi:AcrR family transcriptional regulator